MKTAKKVLALSIALIFAITTTGFADVNVAEDYDFVDGFSGMCTWEPVETDADPDSEDEYTLRPAVYIADGEYITDLSMAGEDDYITDTDIHDMDIEVNGSGYNGIIVNNSRYSVSNVGVTVNAGGNGAAYRHTGKGAAFAAYCADTDVIIEDSQFSCSDEEGLTVFVDNGASVLIKNSELSAESEGLSSQSVNVMGNKTTVSFVGSEITSANGTVISAVNGSKMQLNFVNSVIELMGTEQSSDDVDNNAENTDDVCAEESGYGIDLAGNSSVFLAGTTVNAETYAAVLAGGSVYCGNLNEKESCTLSKADGSEHYTYEAPEKKSTIINSDGSAFLSKEGKNEIVIDGARVNSGSTAFVVISGAADTSISVENNAEINAANGILLEVPETADVECCVFFTVSNADLTGSIFNNAGSLKRAELTVTLEGESSLTGAVSSDKINKVMVCISDNAAWVVSESSLINEITVSDNGIVTVNEGAELTVGGRVFGPGEYRSGDFTEEASADNAIWS